MKRIQNCDERHRIEQTYTHIESYDKKGYDYGKEDPKISGRQNFLKVWNYV